MSDERGRAHNRYDRAVVGGGVVGWVYEYRNTDPIHKRGVATGLELGVQLRGDWLHRGRRTDARLYGPGTVHVISPAETYEDESYFFRTFVAEHGLTPTQYGRRELRRRRSG